MKILLIILAFVSIPTFAAERMQSIGIGLQYGVLGYQLASSSENGKLYGSIGVGSASVGAQKFIGQNKNHGLGLELGHGFYFFDEFASLNYDFYFNGAQSEGFVAGFGISRLDPSVDDIFSDLLNAFGSEPENSEKVTLFTLNLAYQF